MKLTYEDISGRHKGKPCVVSLHGPSLNKDIQKIEELQKSGKIIRFSTNEWFDFFNIKPDYWVVSNGEFNIHDSITGAGVWKERQYPADVFNKYGIPLLYNKVADLTPADFVDDNLTCDYFAYDSKHFKGHMCRQILENFRKHFEEHQNFEFKDYGNNAKMWKKPDINNVNEHCARVHGTYASAWSRDNRCCNETSEELTLQEQLQKLSGHSQHMGPGQTVGLICVVLATLMGCNPIYVSGLDLDYSLGYANKSSDTYGVNTGNIGHWKYVYREHLLDDMKILRESAEMIGSKIINLNHESWYDSFERGEL
jgi:hypothetical protein